jgi:GNAT superfamily N-acetyltransferase
MPTNRDIQTADSTEQSSVSVRRFMTGDSIDDITSLLHRAYARQRETGLDPLAGRQDNARTLDRILNSESYLAFADEDQSEIVGVILFNEHEQATFPDYFLREGVAHFAMFAVDPLAQAAGIGAQLLELCEKRTLAIGATHLSLSMAEPDKALLRYYKRRGYEHVQDWQWPYTNYTSLILAKCLNQ